MDFYLKILGMICIFYLIWLPGAIYSKLTFSEGWYTEGWGAFFKKLFTGKLKFN